MRFKLYFQLEKNEFPIQYHKCIISFIKLSLSEYNPEFYKKLYNDKEPIVKPFTFAVFFNTPIFTKEKIMLGNNSIEFNISVQDYTTAIMLYNSFNHQQNKKFPLEQNSMVLKQISLIPEKEITSDEIKVKFMSPLVVRNRNKETRKDYYHSYKDDQFKETLKINITEELKNSDLPSNIVEGFDLIPIEPKKTVITFYEKQIEASLGTYLLKGDRRLLEYLYKAGIGSKRSAGFGMFTIM